MTDFSIFVRTYKRYDLVCLRTLNFLNLNGLLHKTTLLVADNDERSLYEEALKRNSLEVGIRVTCKGGGRSLDKLFSETPEGERLFLIDDDIKEMFEFYEGNSKQKRPIRNLSEYLSYGFDVLDQLGIKVFSFDYSNMFYKNGKGFASIGTHRFPGGFYGVINCPELIAGFDHEDDNVRSANILDQYGKVMIFNWIGMNLEPIGTTDGGMQSDGSRGKENSLLWCEKALELKQVQTFFESEPSFNESYGFYTLKKKNVNKLKKIGCYSKPIKIETYFGEIEVIEEVVSLF